MWVWILDNQRHVSYDDQTMKDQTRFHNILETKRKLMKHRNTSANLKTNDMITLQKLQHSKAEINMAYDEIMLQPDVLR